MKKYLLIILLISEYMFSDLLDYETKQNILYDVKRVIHDEELIARAYERYILDNYALPSNMNDLYNSSYLGTETNFLSGYITIFSTNFNKYTLNNNALSYSLKDVLKNELDIKAIYESNDFRERTYYRNGKVYILLDDSFAKHLYNLIFLQNYKILDCTNSLSKRICMKDEHIYIYKDDTKSNILFYYYKDKFQTGPMIITNDVNLQYTSEEFSHIPKGVVLFDITGAKYVKTTSGIEGLK